MPEYLALDSMGMFKKQNSTVKRSRYAGDLENIAKELQTKGELYSPKIRAFLKELEARPDRAYAEADKAKFGPIQEEFLKTARNPIDDELTRFYDTQARRATEGRLAERGLIGQGIGEGIQQRQDVDLAMGNRATADARRLGATSAADTIEGNLQARDYAGRNAVLGGIKDIGATDLGYTKGPADIYNNLLGYDAQRYSQDANLEANAMSPFEQLLGTAVSLVGAYAGGSASMPRSSSAAGPSGGGMMGGGAGSSWDYGSRGGSGDFNPSSRGFDLYGNPGGEPGMANYSLYGGDEPGGGGSALRRSGALRFLGG